MAAPVNAISRRAPGGKLRSFPIGASVITYLVFFILCLIVREELEGDDWMVLLAMGGSAFYFTLWWKMDWQGNRLISFGAALLLAGGINRMLYALDVLFNGNHFDNWPVTSPDQGWSLLRGEAATVVGTFLVLWSWQRVSQKQRARLGADPGSARGYWLMYVLPLILLVVQRGQSGGDSGGGSITGVAFSAALVSIMALSSSKTKPGLQGVLLAAALSLPYVFIALGTGMKEALIFSLLPFGLVYWSYLSSLYTRLAMVLIGALLLTLITSYVAYYRERVWFNKADLSTWQVLEEFIALSGADKDKDKTGESMFLERNNATYEHGIAIDVGDIYGARPGDIFGALYYLFIPRFLWHDKPSFTPGWEYASLLYGDAVMSHSTTSIAAGLFPGLYMGGGYVAVVVVSPFLGWMIAWLERLAFAFGNTYTRKIMNWSFFMYALRFDENWPVHAISGPLVVFVYVMVFSQAIQVVANGHWDNKKAAVKPGRRD